MDEIVDLDVIRPKEKKVKLAGKIVDVSYVPCGITFEVDELIRQLQGIDPQKLSTDKTVQKKGFELAIKLCSIFFSVKNPEMNEEWFKKNCSIDQLNVLVDAIKNALISSYEGVERYGKN